MQLPLVGSEKLIFISIFTENVLGIADLVSISLCGLKTPKFFLRIVLQRSFCALLALVSKLTCKTSLLTLLPHKSYIYSVIGRIEFLFFLKKEFTLQVYFCVQLHPTIHLLQYEPGFE